MSLEKRWLVADQQSAIGAAILNPFLGRDRLYLSTDCTNLSFGFFFARITRIFTRFQHKDGSKSGSEVGNEHVETDKVLGRLSAD